MHLNPNIDQARKNHTAWWNRKGMVLNLCAPKANPPVTEIPPTPSDARSRWTDLSYRVRSAQHDMANMAFYADAPVVFNTTFGPGTLAEILGAKPVYEPTTVWYETCISDPDTYGSIRFNPQNNASLDLHMRFIDEAIRRSGGQFTVAMGDIIENLDTLASMRGSQELLMDLVERPDWVHARQREILQAFKEVFELFYIRTRDELNGNAFVFDIWGPGRTCKVQCDFCCMISPAMFGEFVVPYLTQQCDWLDYSMYHLDGETALHHVDALLAIESLDAIQWTPLGASGQSDISPTGGHPLWFDLYKRIKAGGKAVQASWVKAHEIVPLIDAVGPEGLYISAMAPDEATAEKIVQQVEQYR
jgi:hypothetical protein